MPASRAFATIRVEVASSVGPPNIMVPRQIGDIFRPLRPRLRYCIGWVLSVGRLPRPAVAGRGWGKGLPPQITKTMTAATAPHPALRDSRSFASAFFSENGRRRRTNHSPQDWGVRE